MYLGRIIKTKLVPGVLVNMKSSPTINEVAKANLCSTNLCIYQDLQLLNLLEKLNVFLIHWPCLPMV